MLTLLVPHTYSPFRALFKQIIMSFKQIDLSRLGGSLVTLSGSTRVPFTNHSLISLVSW